MPLQATSGAASQDAFGGNGVAVVPAYIEDVFSTYLYTGTGAARTITNNIDLSGKGGLVWIKARSAATNHRLFDTARGATKYLASNQTSASATDATSLTAFNPSSFSLGDDSASGDTVNGSGVTYASWTFREQAKFFDVVTYTGNGTTNSVAHTLASVPGMVIIKKTGTTSQWFTFVRDSSGDYSVGYLNTSDGLGGVWSSASTPTYLTSTDIKVNALATISGEDTNANGVAYVAYLFAHDAGGFGLTGTDNVISCGSFTGNGSATGPIVNVGFEPQWIMIKNASIGATNWIMFDNMRGVATNGNDAALFPNLTNAEAIAEFIDFNATGFQIKNISSSINGSGNKLIYVAIRRGPMKVPTTGTSVFAPTTTNQTGAPFVTTNFPVDLQLSASRSVATGANTAAIDRLRGASSTATNTYAWLQTSSTNAENTSADVDSRSWGNTGFVMPIYYAGLSTIYWNFRRAPSFFDEVCWTGTSADQTLTHNLTVAPELIIYKARATTSNWYTACAFTSSNYSNLQLNLTTASSTVAYSGGGPFSAQPTSTQFSVGQFYNTSTMVAYLFATCAGVSKVGSYTGTGTTQTINCGFTAGSRFIMIKRTDSTGAWYVWDSARGIIAGDDPYLLLNSTAAEVTNTDYVDTAATGFEISSTAPAAINASGGTFIFFAVA